MNFIRVDTLCDNPRDIGVRRVKSSGLNSNIVFVTFTSCRSRTFSNVLGFKLG